MHNCLLSGYSLSFLHIGVLIITVLRHVSVSALFRHLDRVYIPIEMPFFFQ